MAFFIDGDIPSEQDIQRLRLLLSTFTDGSGENGEDDLPGGFNFERVASEWLDGVHIPGTKHIYDVVIPINGKLYGYSCKMKESLNDVKIERHGDCYIEVSNASAEFTAIAREYGVNLENIASTEYTKIKQVSEAIVERVRSWHENARTKTGLTYEKGSLMLHLAWSEPSLDNHQQAQYELFVFDKHIATLEELGDIKWEVRTSNRRGQYKASLKGTRIARDGINAERALDIYLYSGGHVKYYPRVEDAIWRSGQFALLKLPKKKRVISAKAHGYWPELWIEAGGKVPTDETTEEISASVKS